MGTGAVTVRMIWVADDVPVKHLLDRGVEQLRVR